MSIFLLALSLSLTQQEPTENQRDARCTVALLNMSERARDDETKEYLIRAMFFYLGRLSARNASDQIRPIIDAAMKELPQSDFFATSQNCTDRLRPYIGVSRG